MLKLLALLPELGTSCPLLVSDLVEVAGWEIVYLLPGGGTEILLLEPVLMGYLL